MANLDLDPIFLELEKTTGESIVVAPQGPNEYTGVLFDDVFSLVP